MKIVTCTSLRIQPYMDQVRHLLDQAGHDTRRSYGNFMKAARYRAADVIIIDENPLVDSNHVALSYIRNDRSALEEPLIIGIVLVVWAGNDEIFEVASEHGAVTLDIAAELEITSLEARMHKSVRLAQKIPPTSD